MATLLHIDSSLNGAQSVSREVTRSFAETWQEQHPQGTVIYRDLAAQPLPHLTGEGYHAQSLAPEERSASARELFRVREELAQELEQADAVVIGAPMYNYAVSSTLKTWLDHVIITGRNSFVEQSPLHGKPVTVVTSRGGSYAPGTPNEGRDYLHPYLQWLLGDQLGMEVHFIVPELTLARVVPAMAPLIEKADASRARAHEDAKARATTLAGQFAA